MKITNKILSLILALVMLLGVMPLSVFAEGVMTVTVESVNAMPGETVEVDITLADNPGISSFKINVRYGDVLTLTDVIYNSNFMGQFISPETMSNPVTLNWMNYSESCDLDEVFATLVFIVSDTAEADSVADITITYDPDDIFDLDLNNVDTTITAGSVTVLPCVPGDINADGKSNNKDAVILGQFLAEWDVDINAHCVDTNGDGVINNKDLTRLWQYSSNYAVEIWCKCGSYTKCNHSMTATEAKDPTCTEDGNIAYWHCSLCGKYFLDADGAAQTTLDATVLAATGHDVYIKEAQAPTYTEWGWTEGSWCLVCGEVFTESVDLEPIAGYSITYKIWEYSQDDYLAQQGVVHANRTSYIPGDSFDFEDPTEPAGYTFNGWYDAYGDPVKGITASTTGNKTVYAHWIVTDWNLQFDSSLISDDGNKFEVPSDTYKVNETKLLPAPELDGYRFVGWSDDDGNIYTRLPMGTTGHKIFTANWLSDRNQAWSKQDYGEPIIHEEDNTIAFAYEIGEIRNVPLSLIVDYGKIIEDGVPTTKSSTYSITTSKTEMENFTDTVSKATTESFGWTLSSEWSEGVTVSESWLQENEMTLEEAESVCTNEESNWYVSSGSHGTDTTETLDTKDTYDLNTTTKNTKTYNTKDEEKRQDFSAELGLGYKVTTGFEAGVDGEVNGGVEEGGANLGAKLGASLGVSMENEFSANLDLKYQQGKTTTTKTGTEKDNGSSDETGTITNTGTTTTNTTGWNSESGYGGSYSITNERSVNKGLSEKISNQTSYGKEYIGTEGETNSQDFASAETSTSEYSSTITYNTTEYEEVTETYTTENTRRGYHRRVMAGTAHVFGVVAYDIKNNSYCVYTMSIMDDETYPFEDYSYVSAEYNDNQSSVLDFEVPYDIFDYVGNRMCATKGLEVDANGVITAYTGDDTTVIIPEYVRTSSTTNPVVKVTGISSSAFKGNADVELIILSDYITAIPDDAFNGCSSLMGIEGKSITSIGARAFAGCTELKFGVLSDEITYLGEQAFEGLDTMSIKAANSKVVNAAVNSGARQIEILVSDKCTDLANIMLDIPATTEVFAFDGNGKSFNNVIINSNAQKTYLFSSTFNSSSKTPVTIASTEIVLAEVTINATGIGLICTAENAKISLYGESYIYTEKDNAMLCKNITLEKIVVSDVSYYSHLHVYGNLLVCGEIPVSDLMTVYVPWLSVSIDDVMFEKYKLGEIKISFDANGGIETYDDKTIYYGDAYGELPVPTRDYYTFDGWYTAAEDGELITADMKPESVEDIILYAHWALNPVMDWVLESELPEGAEVIDEKWSYTLTETTTSTASSLEGWTLTSSEWEETGRGIHYYGSYPGDFSSGHSLYSKYAKSALSAYENNASKREILSNDFYTYIYYHWCRGNDSLNLNNNRTVWYKYTTTYTTFDAFESSSNASSFWDSDSSCYMYTYRNSSCCGDSYYYYRFNINKQTYVDSRKIYNYVKETECESETEITASDNISNVQKWVQYRAK